MCFRVSGFMQLVHCCRYTSRKLFPAFLLTFQSNEFVRLPFREVLCSTAVSQSIADATLHVLFSLLTSCELFSFAHKFGLPLAQYYIKSLKTVWYSCSPIVLCSNLDLPIKLLTVYKNIPPDSIVTRAVRSQLRVGGC